MFTSKLGMLIGISVRFRRLCKCDLAILSVSPTCALKSVVQGQVRVVQRLGRRNIFALGGRLPLPALPGQVTIVASPATTKCRSFLGRLTGGGTNCPFCPGLFPTLVRNRQARRSIVTTLSQICHRTSYFSIIIVVQNNNTASSLGDFSSCLLTTGYTRFPLPVVANVKRRHSSAVLSVMTRAQVGAPATMTRFLVKRVSGTTKRIRRLRRSIYSLTARVLSERGGFLRSLKDHLPILTVGQVRQGHSLLRQVNVRLPASTRTFLGR